MEGIRTYETRLHLPQAHEILQLYADLYAKVEHTLFKEICKGVDPNTLKKSYLKQFGITARQFNACRVQIQGKIASIKERRPGHLAELRDQIRSIEAKLQKPLKPQVAHQKQRRLFSLKSRLCKLEKDEADGTIRLCFGSKKLFRAQFALEKNGFESHEQWLQAWTLARHSQIFVLGSKDETSGNQSCTAVINEDGTVNLRLRLPKALEISYGKWY